MCLQIDRKRSHPEAVRRFDRQKKWGASTTIADELSRGYGRLDNNGFWEFPLYEVCKEEKP